MTEQLYLHDAYATEFDAVVTAVDGDRVALDRTLFYATGGGQPHDIGTLDGVPVVDVRKDGENIWHTLDGTVPAIGASVRGVVDWDRRHQLMRTHSIMQMVWREQKSPDQAIGRRLDSAVRRQHAFALSSQA